MRKFHSIAALCGDGLRPELQPLPRLFWIYEWPNSAKYPTIDLASWLESLGHLGVTLVYPLVGTSFSNRSRSSG